MSDKKIVSVTVHESVIFNLPKIVINGLVNGENVCIAQKIGSNWNFELKDLYTTDHAQMLAVQDAMSQVHERMKSFE